MFRFNPCSPCCTTPGSSGCSILFYQDAHNGIYGDGQDAIDYWRQLKKTGDTVDEISLGTPMPSDLAKYALIALFGGASGAGVTPSKIDNWLSLQGKRLLLSAKPESAKIGEINNLLKNLGSVLQVSGSTAFLTESGLTVEAASLGDPAGAQYAASVRSYPGQASSHYLLDGGVRWLCCWSGIPVMTTGVGSVTFLTDGPHDRLGFSFSGCQWTVAEKVKGGISEIVLTGDCHGMTHLASGQPFYNMIFTGNLYLKDPSTESRRDCGKEPPSGLRQFPEYLCAEITSASGCRRLEVPFTLIKQLNWSTSDIPTCFIGDSYPPRWGSYATRELVNDLPPFMSLCMLGPISGGYQFKSAISIPTQQTSFTKYSKVVESAVIFPESYNPLTLTFSGVYTGKPAAPEEAMPWGTDVLTRYSLPFQCVTCNSNSGTWVYWTIRECSGNSEFYFDDRHSQGAIPQNEKSSYMFSSRRGFQAEQASVTFWYEDGTASGDQYYEHLRPSGVFLWERGRAWRRHDISTELDQSCYPTGQYLVAKYQNPSDQMSIATPSTQKLAFGGIKFDDGGYENICCSGSPCNLYLPRQLVFHLSTISAPGSVCDGSSITVSGCYKQHNCFNQCWSPGLLCSDFDNGSEGSGLYLGLNCESYKFKIRFGSFKDLGFGFSCNAAVYELTSGMYACGPPFHVFPFVVRNYNDTASGTLEITE